MISAARLPFYHPHKTRIHNTHPVIRFLTFIFYSLIIFLLPYPLELAYILLFLVLLTVSVRLQVPGRVSLIIAAILLIVIEVFAYEQKFAITIIFALSRVFGLSFLISTMAMTTQLHEVLGTLNISGRLAIRLQPALYIVSMSLVVFPSIQYDLGRAIDAEKVRRQGPLHVYHFGGWIIVISTLLVRLMKRAERFTDTILERGYLPGISVYQHVTKRLTWSDYLSGLIVLLPGVAVLVNTL